MSTHRDTHEREAELNARCLNPLCGRSSRLVVDELGRVFRCSRCGTKLPRAGGLASAVWEDDEAEAEPRRSLGVATPTRLGRFQIRGLLGSGTQATVYRAFDPDLEREVALKVPRAGTAVGVDGFLAEAKALARLRHPSILPVFEAGRDGATLYLATGVIEGRSLADELRDGPFSYNRAARIAADLAEALDYAHANGVVHRDVKPANVMIEPAGNILLADFGLAHRVDCGTLSREGVVVGTPAYLAPEHADCGQELADPASDQYSLGVVLYEMVCGRPPFLGPPAWVLYSVRHDDPMPPRLLRPGVPAQLERICLKAMSRTSHDRYPSCRAFADDLRAWSDRASTRRLTRRRRNRALARASGWLRQRPATVSSLLAAIGLTASAILATALVILDRP